MDLGLGLIAKLIRNCLVYTNIMEPVIHPEYSEWIVCNELQRYFSKKEGYSVLLPVSRQQKGFDVLVHNIKTKKSVTFQVKSSRTYEPPIPKKDTTKGYKNITWYNYFKLEKGQSDYYILFGVYLHQPRGAADVAKIKRKKWYEHLLLLLTESEMIAFNQKNSLKRSSDADKMFGFGFDDESEIILIRGQKKKPNFTDKLFSSRIGVVKEKLNEGK